MRDIITKLRNNKKIVILGITLFFAVITIAILRYIQTSRTDYKNTNKIHYRYQKIIIYKKGSQDLVGRLTVKDRKLTYEAEKNSIIGLYIKTRIKHWETATLSYTYEKNKSVGKRAYYTSNTNHKDPSFLIPIFTELEDKFGNKYDIHLER